MADASSKSRDFRSNTRFVRLLAIVAAMALFFTACGESSDLSSATSGSAGDAVDAAEAASDDSGDDVMEDDGAMEGSLATANVDTAGFAPATTTAETSASADAPAEEAADEAADDEEAATAAGQTPATPTAAQRGREIIYTAGVSVGVDDVEAASTQAAQIIEEVGGFVSNQNTTGGAEPRSQITFKVDPENFSTALERLAGIGELRNQTISTDDVTERVVDLTSRIEVTQLGVDRLREAMESASNLEDFARLEELLLSRESDLEVMRGTLRTLRDQIDLATITLVLEQDRVNNELALGVTLYEGFDNGIGCPGGRSDSLRFEPGDEVTICFEAHNDGDQTLTSVSVTETVLGIEGNGDLIEVLGDASALDPGQSLIQAYEITIDRDRALRATVTGVPTNGVTSDAAGPAVRFSRTPEISVNEDAVDPGFGDGFGAGAALLSTIWIVVKVVSGFIIPLLVLLPAFALVFFGLRYVARSRRERKEARRLANQPPPPRKQANPVPVGSSDETGSGETE